MVMVICFFLSFFFLQSDIPVLSETSSNVTAHAIRCARMVMDLIGEIGESLEYVNMREGEKECSTVVLAVSAVVLAVSIGTRVNHSETI